ncbi:hypothetical protein ACRN9F_18605 [Shewanella oncorhynchi]
MKLPQPLNRAMHRADPKAVQTAIAQLRGENGRLNSLVFMVLLLSG